ncbi:MAG: aminodeoxychorismate synthase, component I, partial [Rhodospirillales bacterium]|nr:aminodeoxychorismate synthase, component I [Rhodospirillales bacterium]
MFAVFAKDQSSVFLDSAQVLERLGRYSFIAAEPFQVLESKNGRVTLDGSAAQGDPFEVLAREIGRFPVARQSELPPFQGGVAGYLGYDLGQHLEHLPKARSDDMAFPDLAVGFYDTVIAFDHREKRAWVLSCGHPDSDPDARRARAEA